MTSLDNNYGFNEIVPAFETHNIPIVFATDKNYIPFVSVAIQSILFNSSEKNNYDIIVLCSGVGKDDITILKNMMRGKRNVSIREYNISSEIKKYHLKSCSYYTEAIYYRLFMPFIMKAYDKMIYLDCDLIVEDDIAKLFKKNIDNNYAGAVRDIGMILYKYNPAISCLPDNYFEDILQGVDPEQYFNSGVLLMNLSKLRKDFTLDNLIAAANDKRFLYPDQDGLNVLCKNNIRLFNLCFNTYPYNSGARTEKNLSMYLPKDLYNEYVNARKKPFIIHYNMLEKPWLHPCYLDEPLMIRFWKYAEKSPFFERILFYKPSAFYLSKKKDVISYYEKATINELYRNVKCVLKRNNLDVFFVSSEYVIGKISDLVVKFETIDIDDDKAQINATIKIGKNELDQLEGIYIIDQKGRKYKTRVLPTHNQTLLNGKLIGGEYLLSARYPIGELSKISFYILYKGRYYRIKHYNFSRLFPIDRVNERQFAYINKKIIRFNKNELIIKSSTVKERLYFELKYDTYLLTNEHGKRKFAPLVRLCAQFVKHFLRKPIWIIGCNYLAEDNGFAFFRFMQGKRKDVKTYFAVNDTKSEVASKVKKYGRIVDKYSRRFQWLTLISDVAISSIVDFRLIKPFAFDSFRDILARRRFVFLQHGIITQDLSREHNRLTYNPAIFCTSAMPEYNSLLKGNYFYGKRQVKLTGLPRFDYLYNEPKKIITIMPTWRKYLNGDYGPNSSFYSFYYALLHNEELQKVLKEYGYKLQFKPHPLVLQNINVNDYKKGEDDNCFSLCQDDYTKTFANSNLIVTDYSSAVFDFLYLKKPIVYAQFDYKEFFSGGHAYDKGFIDYETEGFGDVTHSLSETVSTIIEYIRNGCVMKRDYEDRVDKFFKYHDQNNAQRVFDAIMGLK